MKLGVYLHLGPLYGGDWIATLAKAKTLRDAGVRHVFAANAAVDTVAMAKGDVDWLREAIKELDGEVPANVLDWKENVEIRLKTLDEIGLTVGVRPMPLCAEQIAIEDASTTPPKKTYTPDFTIRRTSINAAKMLTLGDHYIYACHEVHDILDGKQRRWLVEQLGPRTIIYYGHRGLWNKYGADFGGTDDLPHVVHVALNAAGATDASAVGSGVVPRDCTAKQIGEFCKMLHDRLLGTSGSTHAHINVTAATSVARMVAMVYEARPWKFDVLMFRNVDDKGNTIHEVPANVLEAIKELDGVV